MTTDTRNTPVPSASHIAAGKYLTFTMAQEEYGIPVLKVREIIKMLEITAVPQVPRHVKGVVNLRGKVVPVVDLRLKFSLAPQPYTERRCIIVVDVALRGARVMLGIVVDAVAEVLNISAEEIEPVPTFGEQVATDCMVGIANVKGTVKILLDLDRVFATDDAIGIRGAEK
jgi:purine-binding chemotaxis protein CheW